MKWRCKSCHELQKFSVFGLFFNHNCNCNKCIRYNNLMDTEHGKRDFIKERDDALTEVEV